MRALPAATLDVSPEPLRLEHREHDRLDHGIRGIPHGIDLRSPSRHPDILGGADLLIKVEEMREATGYRLPVSVKLGAGRVSDDVKIAVKDGFDFIELDGMQGSTGAGSAEVIDYVGVPTLPAIIEAIARWRRSGAVRTSRSC